MTRNMLLAGFALATALAHAQHPEPVAYPSKGQIAELQARDLGECREWARSESGYAVVTAHRAIVPSQFPFPPAASPLPVTPNTNDATYVRAVAACMEGRGYAIR